MADIPNTNASQTATVVKASISEIDLPESPDYKDEKYDLKGRSPVAGQLGDPDGEDLLKG